MAIGGNPHHKRLPRDARHLVNRLLAGGRTGYRRAGVLHAQVAALDYAVSRRENSRKPLPGNTDMHAPGQRVRLGAEVRELLVRLRNSRNLREQQALVREIRHAVLRRIVIHMQRSRVLAAVRKRTAQAAGYTVRKGRQAGRAVRSGTQGALRQLRSPRLREPDVRVRSVSQRRASRVLTDGMRFSRDRRARAPRVRTGA